MNRRYSMMSIAAVVAVAGLLFASTYSQTQMTATSQSIPSASAQASTKAVNDMGGIQLQMPDAFAQIPVDQIDGLVAQGRHVVDVQLTATSAQLPIMGGGTYYALTFNGQVPGPTVRVTQGDIVKVTLTVPSTESTPHSIDMHAGQLSATNFGAVKVGQSATYALIVDKTDTQGGKVVVVHHRYEAAAKEFVLEYNQLYLNADGSYNQQAMFLHNTTQTVVNGMAFGYTPNADINKLIKGDPTKNVFPVQPWNDPALKQYQGHPLFVDLDTHYRLFVVNQGNMPVFFHIVGEIMDRVTQGNHVQAQGTQTWLIGGSQDAIVDVVFDSPGAYVAVNHDYAAIFSGAATVFVAGDPFNLGYHPGDMPNPSDAVPPTGMNSIPQKELVHCLCTDDQAAAIAKSMSG